ncbi:MAG: FAD-dependent oxidoreductase [Candidatus Eremiobacteraeota bacterium]|nr:FAD-dependent oxidoreductase [Candidatus Eremiobacteraeota bacterium]
MADQEYDVVVIGASLGGVAAALRAAEMGALTCLIDPTDWVGGQFTSQGVCKPDENQYIDTVGSTASYRAFRHAVRLWYRNNTRLSAGGASQPLFNPGGPYDPHQPQFAVEPKVGDAILKQTIQAAPRLHWRPNTRVTAANVTGDAIGSITARGPDGVDTTYHADYYLDGTDLGDLLPMVLQPDEWVIGAESHADTGEPNATGVARPNWIQPITYVVALEHRPRGEDHTIAKPANYDQLKAQQNYSISDGSITSMFGGGLNMFNYRQFIDTRNFDDPSYRYDRTTINTSGNDYQAGSIPTGSAATDAQILAGAKAATLGYVYWLQTECPRQDGSGENGFPELRPSTETFGTPDGVAPAAYIRESRRIKAIKTVVQQEIQRSGNPGPRAVAYPDACGVGTYAFMDGHALRGVNPPMGGFWIPTWPVQLPMRALIPRRLTNLLAACKNIGTTHLTSGIFRLHPLEWNAGESAGALAAFCVTQQKSPHQVAGDPHLTRAYQRALLAQGVPLFWWSDVKFGDALFEPVQLAGATGIMTGDGNPQLRFNPNVALDDAARNALQSETGATLPAGPLTRGQAALWLDNAGIT